VRTQKDDDRGPLSIQSSLCSPATTTSGEKGVNLLVQMISTCRRCARGGGADSAPCVQYISDITSLFIM
jgi:hypothetical protein